MTGIIIVGAIGLICAILLVVASHFLSVPIDTRVEDIRGFLPGANCGACGYAGCDAVAEAIVKGEARVDACPGNSTENIAKIAAILNSSVATIHTYRAQLRNAAIGDRNAFDDAIRRIDIAGAEPSQTA